MRQTILRILISISFLGLFAWSLRGNFAGVTHALLEVDRTALGVGFLMMLIASILMGWRLRLCFKAQGLVLRFRDAIHLTLIGIFFNNFLPSAVGGDLVKAYCASLQTGKRTATFSACLMDRIFGLFIFIAIPSVTVLFLLKELDPRVPWIVLATLSVACVGLLLIFNKHHVSRLDFMSNWLKRIPGMNHLGALYHNMHELTQEKWLVLRICVVALAGQMMNLIAIAWAIRALAATCPVPQLLIRTPLVHLFGMLPSFGGLGLREKGFEYFYTPLIGLETAAALAILYLFFLILMSVIGGLLYTVRHDYHFKFSQLAKSKEATCNPS